MQAVILAAGRGKRMNHLTHSCPKPLLLVKEKSLIEHKLDILPSSVREVILVVGYLGDQIKKRIGGKYKNIKITYVWQDEPLGTAHALFLAKDKIRGDFLVLMGDDLYEKKDLEEMIKHEWAILVEEVMEFCRGALVKMSAKGRVSSIVEGQSLAKGDMINTGCYMLGKEIFNYEQIKLPERNEFGLPQTLVSAMDKHEVRVVYTTRWLPVTSPEDILKAEKFLKKTGA